jgi:3-hydroxyacyl-CoA dehydrogenase
MTELVKIADSGHVRTSALNRPEIFEDFRKANARKFRGFLAPEAHIRWAEVTVNSGSFDRAWGRRGNSSQNS